MRAGIVPILAHRYNPSVRSEVVQRLLELNREFYQSFAEEFAETRRRIQPGVQRAVKRIPRHTSVLDLGCGHGELASYLHRTGFSGRYVGVDSSQALLDLVDPVLAPPHYRFLQVDLAAAGWSAAVREATSTASARFRYACGFAVLHHLPSGELRRGTLTELRQLLAPEGELLLSVWDFLASPRLRSRIRAWSEVGLQPDQLEPGDTLLDWRHGGRGLRYVHHFSSSELRDLADASGFMVVDEFRSDGENSRLGLYQIWKRAGT